MNRRLYNRLCDRWECEADEVIAELERQQGRAVDQTEQMVRLGVARC